MAEEECRYKKRKRREDNDHLLLERIKEKKTKTEDCENEQELEQLKREILALQTEWAENWEELCQLRWSRIVFCRKHKLHKEQPAYVHSLMLARGGTPIVDGEVVDDKWIQCVLGRVNLLRHPNTGRGFPDGHVRAIECWGAGWKDGCGTFTRRKLNNQNEFGGLRLPERSKIWFVSLTDENKEDIKAEMKRKFGTSSHESKFATDLFNPEISQMEIADGYCTSNKIDREKMKALNNVIKEVLARECPCLDPI